MAEKLRIIFLGTPEFAVTSLDAIIQNGYEVAAVVTAPDRPAGRGRELKRSAVKEFAVAKRLPVLQPTNLKDPAFIEELRSYKANLQVVVAFRMLPEVVWGMPGYGTFNLHASLLPQYRGAAPINWAIINGETETGVTTFFLQHEIDTGNIIQQKRVPIGPEQTAGELHDILMNQGAQLVVDTLEAIAEGSVTTTSQDQLGEGVLKQAPKIHKPDCRIDWNKPAEEIHNLVRGLSPYPAGWGQLNNEQTVKIFNATVRTNDSSETPGTILTDNKTYIKVACANGHIQLNELQLPGKKRLGTEELLRGFTIEPELKFI